MNDLKLETFMRPEALSALQRQGLHKIAGAMNGVDELTIKEAARLIGEQAYRRRAEMKKIAAGLKDFAALTEKNAAGSPVLEAALQRAVLPALGGAAIGVVPKLMSNEPTSQSDLLTSGALGAVMGGLGGAGMAIHRGSMEHPEAASALGQAIQSLNRPRV